MQFCPQCGRVVSGSVTELQLNEEQREVKESLVHSRRTLILFLLAIYSFPVTITSIFVLLDCSSVSSMIWSSSEVQDWLITHKLNYTLEGIQNYVTYAAICSLLSGILALISLLLVYFRKYWVGAVITCFLAAIFWFWSVIGMIVGFLVAWVILDSKSIFQPDPKPEKTE